MKPYLRRIAELWLKETRIAPLTPAELKEWKESHQRNITASIHETASELVMAYLWARSQTCELCKFELHLLDQALEENVRRYEKWRDLQNQLETALRVRDFAWQKEIREKLREV